MGPTGAELTRGQAIGRYLVLEELGRGGFGRVYVAYDPELDRKVALKLLRAEAVSEAARLRLVREAQAIARLSHPNVVAVHDAGTWEGQVFLAMELVDGGTLAAWLEKERLWREVVEVFLQAGRGLAAAHTAGLVHRDFKPANVLIGSDGRVRVGDFGLARPAEATAGNNEAGSALDVTVTQTGDLLGTPAYMSPEQHQRRPADARSDQFSFCVALYEALYRQRPFEAPVSGEASTASTELPPLMALAAEVLAGRVREPPSSTAVPRRLHRTVLRGLHPAPEERHPSMDALLAELARDPSATYRRAVIAGGVVAALAGVYLFAGGSTAPEPDRCGLAGAPVAEVWNPQRRTALQHAFRATGAPWAERVASKASVDLEAHAGDWARRRVAVCEKTLVRGQQSPELMDLRMSCLDERLGELRALVDVLAAADEQAALKASGAIAGLPPLSYCDDDAALTAVMQPPADPAARARVDALRAELARVRAQREAGRYEEAHKGAVAVVDQLAATAYPPLQAEALWMLGDMLEYAGDYPASLATQERSIRAALAGRHDEYLARAAADQAWVLGVDLSRHDEAARWMTVAEGALARLEDRGELAGHLESYRGSLAATAGRPADAEKHHRRGLELRERFFGPDHPRVAASLNNLGRALRELGRHDEAIQVLQRSLAIKEKTQGPEHPDVLFSLQNLATALHDLKRFDEAQQLLERRRRLAEAVYPAEHPQVATAIDDLAINLVELGRLTDALPLHERALTMRRKNDPASLDESLWNIGSLHAKAGRHAQAIGYLREGLAAREVAMGADAPALARWHDQLADTYDEVRRGAEARQHRQRAAAIRAKGARQ